MPFHSDKESLRGRYRKLTREQEHDLFRWAHRGSAL
jgi:hypothetical protein